MVFGTIVDRHRKHQAMIFASSVTLGAFLVAGGIYLLIPESELVNLGNPMFWVFGAVILFGGVIENMRNIALSTTVTLLVPQERHANANGLVGTVQGLAFLVTSVFSGLSIGLLGMGWTLLIAIVFTVLVLVHLLFMRIPEDEPKREANGAPLLDLRGSWTAVRAAKGSSPSSSSPRSTTSSAACTWRSWTRMASSSSRWSGGASCSASRRPGSSSAACWSPSSGSAATRSAPC